MVKLKCIQKDIIYKSLTLNKIYNLISEQTKHYYVINDKGFKYGYLKKRFIIIKEVHELW